jgi:actin-related protein 6
VGHSFTHIVPYWGEKKLKHAITRLNIGGKLLTNYLKEIISYRQLNLMDEFRMCQEIKVTYLYHVFKIKEKLGKTLFLVEKIQVRHEEKGRIKAIVCIT